MTTTMIKETEEKGKVLPKKYFSKFKKSIVQIPNLAKDQVELVVDSGLDSSGRKSLEHSKTGSKQSCRKVRL